MRIIVVLLFATSVSYACGSASAPKPPLKLASVKVLAGASQQGTVGTALASPIVLQALDSSGHPIAGLPVIYGPPTGSTVNPTSDTTDASGKASTVWTLGPNPGADTLLFSVGATTIVQGAVYATANP